VTAVAAGLLIAALSPAPGAQIGGLILALLGAGWLWLRYHEEKES